MLQEPGHEKVREVIDRASVHAVNVAEVIGKLVREGVPRKEAEDAITELDLEIVCEFNTSQAVACGELLAKTRPQGLSLGDCICLTAALWAGGTAVTTDRKWEEVHGQRLDGREIRVQLVR
jgi:PIN domain nuclease of toxin-antitoxin system